MIVYAWKTWWNQVENPKLCVIHSDHSPPHMEPQQIQSTTAPHTKLVP